MIRVKNLLIAILTFLGVLVIGYNFYVAEELKYDFGGDAADFIHLGVTLAKTGKYGHLNLSHKKLVEEFMSGELNEDNLKFSERSTWRPPVWPVLIALCFLVSGYSLSFLILVKFSLHLLGGWFFYRTLHYFKTGKILSYIALFLYIVNPAWQLYSRVFLSEPITLFVITLFIWSLVRSLKTGRAWWLNALLGGLLILTHPYYIFFPFSVWLFLFLYKKMGWKRTIVLAGLAVMVVSVWVIRNFIVLDTEELVITTSSGAVMAKGWNEKVPELHTNTKGDLADEGLVLENYNYQQSDYSGPTGMTRLYKDAAFHFIKSNPDMILPIIIKKLKSAFNPFPETPRPGLLETGRVVYQVLALLAAFTILFIGTANIKPLVWGLFLSTILISIITYSGFRFRMPQSGLEILIIIVAIEHVVGRYLVFRVIPE